MSAPVPVIFNNNVLRDGHQSLAATRMSTAQMLPVCELLDNWGFGSLETWGGATIDAGLRFLKEWPFDRLDALKKACPKTKHMMLLRGQNIVAYAHQPDDVVEAFIKMSVKHGMDIFRIFDALNDPRNMRCAIEAAKKAGAEAHGVICYTTSPVHSIKGFIKMGCELEEIGASTIVIKDMAGLIPPQETYELVKGLKANLKKAPVWIHTHETAGMGVTTYYAAIEAGVDAIDTSVVPFANGTGQPDAMRMYSVLKGHPRCPKFSDSQIDALSKVRVHMEKVYEELSAFTSHTNEIVDNDALIYQVPGGMLSNFRNQLKEFKMEDKFAEVFAEVPVVREALGWIPLVTPTSQIVGNQAFFNVKMGRWKQLSKETIDVALGYYGTTPAPVNPEVQAMASKQAGLSPITCRPVDSTAVKRKGMEDLRKELASKGYPTDDEHCVIWAMFPQQVEGYYKAKSEPAPAAAPVAPKAAAPVTSAAPVAFSGRSDMVLSVSGKKYNVTVEQA
jgi:oxaloacetate decarboxylase alpha subunit/pyruvate carboxylase subunit B